MIGLILDMQSVAFLERLTFRLKRTEVWIYDNFYIYQISIELWNRNTLIMQKSLQNDMIFFERFKVSTVNFGKCFAEF